MMLTNDETVMQTLLLLSVFCDFRKEDELATEFC